MAGDPTYSLLLGYIVFNHKTDCCITKCWYEVSKGAKIRNRYDQVPLPTQDINGKVTNSQLDSTNESQDVSPFSEGDHVFNGNLCHKFKRTLGLPSLRTT